MNRERVDAAIGEIRDYTATHVELQKAHHFVYDYPLFDNIVPEFIVMGLNPGETPPDWNLYPTQREQTSNSGFRSSTSSALKWAKKCSEYTGSERLVSTEFFFWSTPDTNKRFRQRFGTSFWKSQHCDFCVRTNRILFEEYQPRAVFFTGIGNDERVAAAFGLEKIYTHHDDFDRLVEHYHDGHRHWFITQHWTGAHLRAGQPELIKEYIHPYLT